LVERSAARWVVATAENWADLMDGRTAALKVDHWAGDWGAGRAVYWE
jgi:hypothetical protein